LGEDPENTFNIHFLVDYDLTVSDLKREIRKDKDMIIIFKNTLPKDMEIWQVEISITDKEDEKYQKLASRRRDIDIKDLGGTILAEGGISLSDCWKTQPASKTINVIVQRPHGK